MNLTTSKWSATLRTNTFRIEKTEIRTQTRTAHHHQNLIVVPFYSYSFLTFNTLTPFSCLYSGSLTDYQHLYQLKYLYFHNCLDWGNRLLLEARIVHQQLHSRLLTKFSRIPMSYSFNTQQHIVLNTHRHTHIDVYLQHHFTNMNTVRLTLTHTLNFSVAWWQHWHLLIHVHIF
jgi:hypothetical protein